MCIIYEFKIIWRPYLTSYAYYWGYIQKHKKHKKLKKVELYLINVTHFNHCGYEGLICLPNDKTGFLSIGLWNANKYCCCLLIVIPYLLAAYGFWAVSIVDTQHFLNKKSVINTSQANMKSGPMKFYLTSYASYAHSTFSSYFL